MIYERIEQADGNEALTKLPVWPLVSGLKRILTGKNTTQQVATYLGLDAGETAELTTMVGTLQAKQTTYQDALPLTIGLAVRTALANSVLFDEIWSMVLDVELGVVNQTEFNAYFGL